MSALPHPDRAAEPVLPLQRGPRLGAREFLLVLCGYLLICLVYWWPFLSEPAAHYSVGRDYFQNNWNLWWTRTAWAQGEPFLFTDRLFAPNGTSLAFHTITFANTIPGLLLQDWLGQTATHSVLFVTNFFLSALAAWALARHVTASPWGAFAAGVVYSFTPYHTAMVTQLNNSQFQWLPLFLLALIHLAERGRWWHVAWAAVFLSLCGYADWYQPVFAVLAGGVWLLVVMLRDRRLGELRLWGRVLLMGTGAALLMLPGVLPLLREIRAAGAGSELEDPIRYVGETQLLGMNPNGSPAFHAWPVVLGYGSCLLALYAMLRVRLRGIGPWWWLIAVGFLFLLGPELVVLPGLELGWFKLPMAVFPHLPGLSMIRVPHRFLILVVLALAVIVAFAVRVLGERLAARRGPAARAAVGAVAALVVAAEMKPATREPIDLQAASIYEDLAADADDYTVLEMPIDFRDGYVMWLQTQHGKKLPHGYTSHIGELPLTSLKASDAMRALLPDLPEEARNDIPHLPEFFDLEEERGVSASELDAETARAWRAELSEVFGVRVVLFHEGPDFPAAGLEAPDLSSFSFLDKLRVVLTPFCFNDFTRDNQRWRQLAARNFVSTLATSSAQGRAVLERLYGPPTDVQGVHGRTLVWDLRGS